MKFEPLSLQELSHRPPLPEGDYKFIVLGAEDKETRMDLKLECSGEDGKKRFVYTSIYDAHQMGQFALASGLIEQYNLGEISPEFCLEKHGKCKLGIKTAQPKNDGTGDFWPPKNVVKQWYKAEVLVSDTLHNDDVPF